MKCLSLRHLVDVIISTVLVLQCPTLTTSADITIGGLFDAFSYTQNGSLTKNDKECQHLAAFMMAVDEVNRKNDGIYDDLLINNTEVKMAINPGQSVARLYPANPYYDGTASVYQIYQSSPSVIASVETNSDLAKVTASASSLNSFGSVAMLSSSPSSEFNDAMVYPMTLQIAPTFVAEAVIILKLISKMEWKNIVIFPTTDIAGIDSFANFLGSASDISILGVQYLYRGTTDFSPQITAAKATGAKIFIFFLEGTITGLLLEQGYNAGLFQEGTQVIATSTSNINDIRGAFSPAGKLNEANILKGFMSTAPHPGYYFGTPQGQSFITRFRKLPPTIRVDPITKAKTCSSRTIVSSNGSYSIEQRTNIDTFYDATDKLCLGFESFEAFNQSGDNLDPNIMFTYDAVYTYLIAAAGLERSGVPLTAERLFTYIVSNFYPSLVTGQAVFMPGRGTRSLGNVFKLLNYQPDGKVNEHSVGGLAFVGEYTDAFGWLLCDSDDTAHMTDSSRTACSQPLYRMIPSSTRPSDAPPPILGRLPNSFKAILITFSSFGLCTLAVWTVFLIMFWNAKPIRRGQPRLMAVLLLGGLMGLVKVFLSAADVTQASCITQLWFSHFAFRLIFRTLLLKVWRINAVVNARGFKRVIIAESTVFWFLCCDIAFTSLFLLLPITILSYVNQGMVGYVSDNIKNQIYNYPECQVRVCAVTSVSHYVTCTLCLNIMVNLTCCLSSAFMLAIRVTILSFYFPLPRQLSLNYPSFPAFLFYLPRLPASLTNLHPFPASLPHLPPSLTCLPAFLISVSYLHSLPEFLI